MAHIQHMSTCRMIFQTKVYPRASWSQCSAVFDTLDHAIIIITEWTDVTRRGVTGKPWLALFIFYLIAARGLILKGTRFSVRGCFISAQVRCPPGIGARTPPSVSATTRRHIRRDNLSNTLVYRLHLVVYLCMCIVWYDCAKCKEACYERHHQMLNGSAHYTYIKFNDDKTDVLVIGSWSSIRKRHSATKVSLLHRKSRVYVWHLTA